jgi:hypothetical protein
MRFSPHSCYLASLRPKYSPQHPNYTYHCATIAYSNQYSNMLYRFVAQEQ